MLTCSILVDLRASKYPLGIQALLYLQL